MQNAYMHYLNKPENIQSNKNILIGAVININEIIFKKHVVNKRVGGFSDVRKQKEKKY